MTNYKKTNEAPQQVIMKPQVDTGGATIATVFTLRDTFAMYALMSFPMELDEEALVYLGEERVKLEENISTIMTERAKYAYMQADAMIAERAKNLKYKRKGEV